MSSSIRNATRRRTKRVSQRERRPRRGAQPRPDGPFHPVDAQWKIAIRALLDSKGISQAELARRIGASPGSIVLLFKPDTTQSRLVPAIHKALDLVPPSSTLVEAA